MHAIDEGHKYQLRDGQEIRFIKKVKNEKTGEFETVWTGTTNEELLEVLIDRTTALNAKLPSQENSVAIHHMEEALEVFNARTRARQKQGVESTPLPHTPEPNMGRVRPDEAYDKRNGTPTLDAVAATFHFDSNRDQPPQTQETPVADGMINNPYPRGTTEHGEWLMGKKD